MSDDHWHSHSVYVIDKMSSLTMTTTTKTFCERFEHSITPNAFRSYLAEFISTFLFVFVAIGSTMASRKLMPDAMMNPSCLIAVAMANAFGLSSAIYISINKSGGHVNPAVTFGLVVGGHISVPMAMFYWAVQLMGSTLACLLLRVATADNVVPTHAIAVEMTGFGASILEGVLTFSLVYTVYAAGDPKKGTLGAIGPLVIGFMAGANVLAAGPFTGGSMNPASSFGSALINGNFKNQAVYWVGPLIGAATAGLLYDNVVFPPQPPPEEASRGGGMIEDLGANIGF